MNTVTQGGAPSAEQTGRRVEEVLDRLAATGDRVAGAAAEELVRALMDFYGAGLARAVALLDEGAGAGTGTGGDPGAGRPSPALARLLDDELVAGLLVLHDLHPYDVTTRIRQALAAVPDHPAEVLGFDPGTGTLRLRLEAGGGGGCGCASTAQSPQQSIEGALACLAPEVTTVELEAPEPRAPEPVLLQIGARPAGAR
ncbi:thioredoxin [Kitasatospora indigofera]|uniref:Thioredoxin n=1 Tax=Kitasatospora indigofera TaxID=67307 RepID=A0A919G9F8_9ACTN|nr:hypothetical protein [Kitasatospora indigofera]GHH79710.1 thioredoxin [Kitasatospora indigofera]